MRTLAFIVFVSVAGATAGGMCSAIGETSRPLRSLRGSRQIAVARGRARRLRDQAGARAIKVLHPELGAALGGDRLLSEIRTTARLQHPHILPLLDSGEADGLLYYVMPPPVDVWLKPLSARQRRSCAPTPSPPFSPTAS